AQSLDPVVDWSWISIQFLETFSPAEDQVEAAMERFSPRNLRERWLYLQNGCQSPVGAVERLEEPNCKEAASSSGEGVAEPSSEASADEAGPLGSPSAVGPQGCKGRDRVLDAMQNFLFGRPVPRKTPTLAVSEPTFAEVVVEDAKEEELQEESSSLHRTTSAGSSAEGTSNAALRKCLEELRWHGEALRCCAAGADAWALCEEAAARRKALLWNLGVGPDGPAGT
ncbi:unnamed protein product, partial [Polarella glacialis]